MKTFNYWYLNLVVILSLGCYSCAQNKVTFELAEDEKLIEFTTDRFTLPNLHVTPNGKHIIFDVLGDIYQVPIEGGKAEVLLQDNNWKRAGKLSPDGETLAYVSDETGEFQVWTMGLKSKKKRVYSIKEFLRYPLYAYWGIDGQLLIPEKYGLRSYSLENDNYHIVRAAKEDEYSPMHTINRKVIVGNSGKEMYIHKNDTLRSYSFEKYIDQYVGKFKINRSKTLVKVSDDSKKIIYFKTSIEDYNSIELRYWNLETNNIKSLYKTKDVGFSTNLDYSFDFIDNSTIVLDKKGKIVRMDIETGEYDVIPIEVEVKKAIKKPLRRAPQYITDSIITASVLRNPVTRPGLDTIYLGAFGKLHSYVKITGNIKEMYPDEDRFEVSPSLSPDGKYLAYTTWNDIEMGHVYIRVLSSGEEYQLTHIPGRYINPAWSPDGTEIAFVADETKAKMGLPRQSDGPNFKKYYMDLHIAKINLENRIKQVDTVLRIFPFSQMPNRFYPIPVYHPSSKNIFLTTRNHEKNLPVIIEIDLENKEVVQERLIPFHTDEVLISPDAKHIAFIFDEQVWVDTFPHSLTLEFDEYSEFTPKQYHYKGGIVNNILLPEAKSVYEVAPSYLYWKDKNTLLWGSAEEVYTYNIRTEKTEKIADIKVQRPRAFPKTQYALTNARVITMNKQDEIIEIGTVLVKNNRIQAVGKVSEIMIPENYKIFDLKGKTIMPGLIDVHAHYFLNPFEIRSQQNNMFIGNLAYGVTTIYDPSVITQEYREQAQMVETGSLIGPRVFASGNIITGDIKDYGYRKLRRIRDFDRIMESNIKLGVSGPLKQYNLKNRKHRQWLYNSAKSHSMTITNHEVVNYNFAITQIIDGYTAMEHEKYTFPIQKDIIQLIGQSGIFYTPTFIVSPGINSLYYNETEKEKSKLIYYNSSINFHNNYGITISEKETKKKSTFQISTRLIYEQNRAINTIKEIIFFGGRLTIGGHGNPLPGIGTHWELWFMSKGMSYYQALQAATIKGAEKLDLQEEIGSLEKGKLADLVVLNSNPLKEIYNTTDILYTVHNGNVYESDKMSQIYPMKKGLRLWGWESKRN